MTEATSNPLSKYFRQPQIYIKLPSGGEWWPAGSLDLPVNKEIPIYAMTAKDELSLKTPDALMNGQATVDIIQSCVPAVKNAWHTPSVDIDALLIAIRQATYGNRMEIVSVCPHCSAKNENAVDLSVIQHNLSCPDFKTPVSVEGLEVYLKPQSFFDINQRGIKNYEEQRLLSIVSSEELSETEKLEKFNALFKNVLNLTVAQMAMNVGGIKTPEGIVENRQFLNEFFANCDRPIWNAVRDRIANINETSSLKNIPITCDNDACLKEYSSPLQFELTNFFG